MNAATEQIIRWHLSTVDGADEHLETLIEALRLGTANREANALELMDTLLVAANEASLDSPDADLISRLFKMHAELELLDDADRKLDALLAKPIAAAD